MNSNVETQTLHQNIIARPENLVASAEVEEMDRLIATSDYKSLTQESFATNHLSYHLFQEAITNATDNYEKSVVAGVNPGIIKVTVSDKRIEIFNEGLAMSCEYLKHKEMYNPQCAMFTLLSSTNYNDDSDSTTGGRNGVGGTCCSIFSKWSEIYIVNAPMGIEYRQSTCNNMFVVNEPVISNLKAKTSSFTLKYDLDFDLVFKNKEVDHYTEQMKRLLARITMEAAASTGAVIYFNGEKIHFPTLRHFGDIMLNGHGIITEKQPLQFYNKDFKTNIVIYDTPFYGKSFGYCNGIPNTLGGSHVVEVIKKRLSPLIKDAFPKINCTPSKLAKNITVLVSCRIPTKSISYDGQRKEKLVAKTYKITFNTDEKETIVSKMSKWEALQAIHNMKDEKFMEELNDKKKYFSSVKSCFEAKWAGKNPEKCSLIICEGKSTVNTILKSIDTDFCGLYAIRGKILNTSKSGKNKEGIEKKYINKIITDIIKIMGITPNKDYSIPENMKSMRYHQLHVMTDADPDGDHIKILVYNVFRSMFPSLFSLKGFLHVLYTALITVNLTGKREKLYFYDNKSYETWREANNHVKHTCSYLKGLGSIDDAFLKCQDKNTKLEKYHYDSYAERLMALAMDRDYTNERKKWIEIHMRKNIDENVMKPGTISRFVNETMMRYNVVAVERHLPSIVDGLKPVQRKILWSAMKLKKVSSSIEFMGTVMKETNYHHGDSSLYKASAAMISSFRGINNFPLMTGSGQFGTIANAEPSAPRYTSMGISPFGNKLMSDDMKSMLEFNFDGPKMIEPKFMLFPYPMFALNGNKSLAIGWNSQFPGYHPNGIVNFIKVFLIKKYNPSLAESVHYPELVPYFKHFDGIVRKVVSNTKECGYYYVTEGSFSIFQKRKKVIVTGFPVGMTCKKYLKKLEEKVEHYASKKKSKLEYKNIVKNDKTKQEISIKPNIEIVGHEEPLTLDSLGLKSVVDESSIVLLSEEGFVLTFRNMRDALEHWCNFMCRMYTEMKLKKVNDIKKEIDTLESKRRYISDCREGVIDHTKFKSMTVSELKEFLKLKGHREEFINISHAQLTSDSYDRLTSEIENIRKTLDYYMHSSIPKIWTDDMDRVPLE